MVTFDEQIFDSYLVADPAAKAPESRCCTTSPSPISRSPQMLLQSALRVSGFTHYRYVDNLQIERIESHHAFHSGIQVQSVINSRIADCYIHHIRDRQPPQNVHYGIVVSAASQNVSITGCRFYIHGMQ